MAEAFSIGLIISGVVGVVSLVVLGLSDEEFFAFLFAVALVVFIVCGLGLAIVGFDEEEKPKAEVSVKDATIDATPVDMLRVDPSGALKVTFDGKTFDRTPQAYEQEIEELRRKLETVSHCLP